MRYRVGKAFVRRVAFEQKHRRKKTNNIVVRTFKHFNLITRHKWEVFKLAYSVRSLGMPYAPEHFKKLYGEDFDYDKVHTYRRKLTDQVLDEGPIEAKPGAEELLKYLRKKGVRTAIATAGGVERSSSLLKRVGLYDYLDHIVSARQVAHGKPAPDVYLCSHRSAMRWKILQMEFTVHTVQDVRCLWCRI